MTPLDQMLIATRERLQIESEVTVEHLTVIDLLIQSKAGVNPCLPATQIIRSAAAALGMEVTRSFKTNDLTFTLAPAKVCMTYAPDVIADNQWLTVPEHGPQIKLVVDVWEIEIDKRTFEVSIPKDRETDENVVIEVRAK